MLNILIILNYINIIYKIYIYIFRKYKNYYINNYIYIFELIFLNIFLN
jgi:hypothetical protein